VLHIERYYTDSAKLSQTTLALHHNILATALNAAVKKGLLRTSPASKVTNKPHRHIGAETLDNVWTVEETRTFLSFVKTNCCTQDAALFALAIDSGARKAELLGLRWTDLQDTVMRIQQQLLKGGKKLLSFGLPKRGGVRSVDLSAETVALLQVHKREQAELKMKNRLVYRDLGLVFAQRWEDGRAHLGMPLDMGTVNAKLESACAIAGVKRITPHGLRHTSATLLLAAGVPPHVVQRRLGHKKVEMTLGIYSHVLPSMQQEAAAKLAALLT